MKHLTRIAVFSFFSCFMTSCGDSKKTEEDPVENSIPVAEHHQEVENSVIAELSSSPRHHEWVDLRHGDREFKAFVVYPESEQNTKSVIVIHENRGFRRLGKVVC